MAQYLPNELFDEILKHIPASGHQLMALTSRRLCGLTRPFLFAELQFIPYHYGRDPADNREIVQLHSLENTKEYEARLAFVTSEDIAPLVRSVQIDVVERKAHVRPWNEPPEPRGEGVNALLHLLLSNLERFQALTSFRAEFTFLPMETVAFLDRRICRSHRPLVGLHLIHCDYLDESTTIAANTIIKPHSLRLTDLTIRPAKTRPNDSRTWLHLLDPDTLRCLYISDAWLERGKTLPVFPHVHSLTLKRVPSHEDVIPHLQAAITSFPNLEILRVDYFTGGLSPVLLIQTNAAAFPYLREFTGSAENAVTFLAYTQVTCLQLLDLDEPVSQVSSLAKIAGGMPASVKSLKVGILTRSSSVKTLRKLLLLLPNLTRLSLRIKTSMHPDWKPYKYHLDIVSKIHNILPRSLEELVVYSQGMVRISTGNLKPGTFPPYDTASLRYRLLLRCPRMRSILIEFHTFFLEWKAGLGGEDEENTQTFNMSDDEDGARFPTRNRTYKESQVDV
ncbi:hypothetical protein MIND_00936000 [Mycena indigotica]|uniref:F-box domain-containing protein n=1 Tax=Mycena indigotica TaxID=2126181 RepID=A0A8H6SCJ0_9AGAR|nr:uncharacterized protein MIND_00936000 [Mycena indigotica]KAF7297035.1 hypothetical protein MIND_00936000 [Mycena indigotica]